ncbi:MAG TPA: Crp/Fnr family transcriptional regulator [Solirubrobacteraceae bacterium]|nr:Crp/Fnr family transcriptional regulator [Solirubrobacteraceae bacterium]
MIDEPTVERLCRVLEEDPDLAESLAEPARSLAARECIAQVIVLDSGPWLGTHAELGLDSIGLLVLDGTLLRRVGVEGRFGAELLGQGDLLRPWQGEDEPPTLPTTTGWRVLEPARLAVLGDAFARRLARHPQIIGRIIGRAVTRSRNLAVNMAIVHQARVDVRLHMLFWHLAERWGRVRGDGVLLPLRLTHNDLADLVAATRPTVTTALTELARRNAAVPGPSGWLLVGDPPGELMELGPVAPTLANGAGPPRLTRACAPPSPGRPGATSPTRPSCA